MLGSPPVSHIQVIQVRTVLQLIWERCKLPVDDLDRLELTGRRELCDFLGRVHWHEPLGKVR